MVSERLKTLFGKAKERLGELKPEDVAKFAVKEAVGVIPVVGQIIKDAFDEFSPDEKEELIKELKALSERQLNEISEKIEVSVEYLKDVQKITLYTFEELRADHEEIIALLRHLMIEIQTRGGEVKPPRINIPTIQSALRKGETSSKTKLIIGSRETEEIRKGHPKEGSEFEHLSKTYLRAKEVTEEMITTLLKKKHHFDAERIKRVSASLEKCKTVIS
ncbi:MAG: hypothetical protein IBX41_03070 [Methanophagales archaeon]|nr:hypothetical protein [Methanophagales archaeon]